jgi:hypothetical protein
MGTNPFGVAFGARVDTYGAEHVRDNIYRIRPPTPHPLLVDYLCEASEQIGIVWLKAISRVVENDSYGGGVKDLADRLAGQISSRYGTAKKFDFLADGSIWSEPREWVQSITLKERFYSFTWEGTPQLPPDIKSLFVGVTAYDNSNAAVVVEYMSTLFSDYEKELEAQQASFF